MDKYGSYDRTPGLWYREPTTPGLRNIPKLKNLTEWKVYMRWKLGLYGVYRDRTPRLRNRLKIILDILGTAPPHLTVG